MTRTMTRLGCVVGGLLGLAAGQTIASAQQFSAGDSEIVTLIAKVRSVLTTVDGGLDKVEEGVKRESARLDRIRDVLADTGQLSTVVKEIKQGLRLTKELLDDAGKVEMLLADAIDTLNSIDPGSKRLDDPVIADAIRKLKAEARGLQERLRTAQSTLEDVRAALRNLS